MWRNNKRTKGRKRSSEKGNEFVDDLQSRLNKIGGSISETFFALRPVKQSKAVKSGASVSRAAKKKVESSAT